MLYYKQTSIYNIENVKIHIRTKCNMRINTILIASIVGLESG